MNAWRTLQDRKKKARPFSRLMATKPGPPAVSGAGEGRPAQDWLKLPRKNLRNVALKVPTPTKSRGARASRLKPFTDGLRTKQRYFLLSILNGFESSSSGRMRSWDAMPQTSSLSMRLWHIIVLIIFFVEACANSH